LQNFIERFPNCKILLGIDEAGRGSVIGPLIIGMVIADETMIKEFERLGITDSKLLKKEKRDELRKIIKEKSLKTDFTVIEASEIDLTIRNYNDNLNYLELRRMSEMVHENIVSHVYIDAISTPVYCTTFISDFLKKEHNIKIKRVSDDKVETIRRFNKNQYITTIIAQNKADLAYKIVSAASIIAKTERDKRIRAIEKEHSFEPGILASGYANNQLLGFLKKFKREIKNREFEFIRYNWDWEPLQSILHGKKEQKKLEL
jgi:ribonuclease HII